MKLELDRKEVEAVLLAYAEQKWPGAFNSVSGTSYHSIGGVEFSNESPRKAIEPPTPDEPLRAVA